MTNIAMLKLSQNTNTNRKGKKRAFDWNNEPLAKTTYPSLEQELEELEKDLADVNESTESDEKLEADETMKWDEDEDEDEEDQENY